MKNAFRYRRIVLLILCAVALAGCQKPQQGPTPLPEYTIGVAEFTQPAHKWDLLAGYIPENQPKLDETVLRDLDASFQTLLQQETTREYTSYGASARCLELDMHSSTSSTTALEKWINVGLCMQVDLLLVPQILSWKERDGGEMGAFHPASVAMDIFVIDVRNERALSRFHFEETQESLTNNLMNISKFVERKGKWITPLQLAEEGMRKGIKELGL